MVETTYTITVPLSQDVYTEIANQPNMISVEGDVRNTYYIFKFDHTPAQSIAFKKFLNTRLGLYNDALSKYTSFNGAASIYDSNTPVVLTNIGTTFKNVYARSDGMSFGFDSDVYEKVRLQVHWTRAAGDTGVHSLQIVEKNTPANVLVSISNLTTGSNITGDTDIPAVMQDTAKLYLIQVKSTVATDDPTFEGVRLYAK